MNRMMLSVCMALFASTIGCGGTQDEQVSTEEIGQQEALLWTGWTSEELPPLECEAGRLINGAECSGSYCDNIRVDCTDAAVSYGSSYWTTNISEETGARYCGPNEWATGIQCRDGYCDNVYLECTQITNRSVGSCYWSGWISDGTVPSRASAGYYLRGAECRGWWCDDMRFYYCSLW